MTELVKLVYLVALSGWVGSIVFFSAVVAPTVHRTLDSDNAVRLIWQLFPKYYLIGITAAGVGILCVGILLYERAFSLWPGCLSLLLLAGAGATDFWLRQTILPTMNALPKDDEWRELHRLSVRLNLAVLVTGLALLFLLVYARVV